MMDSWSIADQEKFRYGLSSLFPQSNAWNSN